MAIPEAEARSLFHPGVSSGLMRLGGSVPGKLTRPMVAPPPLPVPQPVEVKVLDESPEFSVGEPASRAALVSAARSQGYTGNQCTHCGSLRMKISGHCQVCDDCGTTTGCS